MTELEKIEYAKSFIDKLAQGINPLNDEPVPENELVNQIRISRCFFYVSDILRKVIEGVPFDDSVPQTYVFAAPVKKKELFDLSPDKRENFVFSEEPLTASEICKRLTDAANEPNMRKLSYAKLTEWLLSRGFLTENTTDSTRGKRVPSELGEQLGIFLEHRTGVHGEYDVVMYNHEAQQFILDNLDSLIAFVHMPKSHGTHYITEETV